MCVLREYDGEDRVGARRRLVHRRRRNSPAKHNNAILFSFHFHFPILLKTNPATCTYNNGSDFLTSARFKYCLEQRKKHNSRTPIPIH